MYLIAFFRHKKFNYELSKKFKNMAEVQTYANKNPHWELIKTTEMKSHAKAQKEEAENEI